MFYLIAFAVCIILASYNALPTNFSWGWWFVIICIFVIAQALTSITNFFLQTINITLRELKK